MKKPEESLWMYRQNLRELLAREGIPSNPGVDDEWILNQLAELIRNFKKTSLNVSSKSRDWRGARLSNFSADAFILDGNSFASVEGFIQGIKFPEGSLNRHGAFESAGIFAKRLGSLAERKYVWWHGVAFHYGSDQHRVLIERAIRAKFEQNPEAMRALLATKDLILIHETGEQDSPDTSLPATIFCNLLMRIREEARTTRT